MSPSPDRVQAERFLFSVYSDHGNQIITQVFESFEWERTLVDSLPLHLMSLGILLSFGV